MYILPIGGLYGTYHLLREPGNSMGPWDADEPMAIASQISSGSVGGTSLLRFCRLIRLVRIVKVFRIKASASGETVGLRGFDSYW